jgi:DNA-directed RNA polymerase specialized sigma24 family protein
MQTGSVMLTHFLLLTAEEQRATVCKLAAQGWSDSEIGRALGVHVVEVSRALSEQRTAPEGGRDG